MDAPLGLRLGDTLYAMSATLELEDLIRAVALHREGELPLPELKHFRL
jgi:hypothetical protein